MQGAEYGITGLNQALKKCLSEHTVTDELYRINNGGRHEGGHFWCLPGKPQEVMRIYLHEYLEAKHDE